MKYLLDSNFCISVLRRRGWALDALASVPVQEVAVSAITVGELYHGAHRADQPRKEVAKTLLTFVNRLGVRLAEKELLLDALERVQKTGIHLVDAYLAASATESKLPVASFDRDFDKFHDVRRFEPKA